MHRLVPSCAQLSAARAAAAVRSSVPVVEGADAGLRSDGGKLGDERSVRPMAQACRPPHLGSRTLELPCLPCRRVGRSQRERFPLWRQARAAALDTALETFVGDALGSAEQWSTVVKPKKKKKKKKKVLKRPAEDEEEEGSGAAADGKRAAPGEPPAPKRPAPPRVARVEVAGAGAAEVNGTYVPDGRRDGVTCYRQAGGCFTLERDSGTEWSICQDYGFTTWCHVPASTAAPPADGWRVSDACAAPPPSLRVVLEGDLSADDAPAPLVG